MPPTYACANDCGRSAMTGHDLCRKCDEQVLDDEDERGVVGIIRDARNERFACIVDESAGMADAPDDGYEPSDPKSSGYAERMYERADHDRKAERENR